MAGQVHIIIVDDEPAIRFSLHATLERDGYQVTAVESGEEALRRAQETYFDLALIDLRLKGMDGIQLLKTLRRHFPDLAIIVLTAHASMETAIEALRYGAHDYLFKPCKTVELRESIASGLFKRQRELHRQALLAQMERDQDSNLEEMRRMVAKRSALEALTPETPGLDAVGAESSSAESEEYPINEARFIRRGQLSVDMTRHVITLNGKILELSPTEFNLLAYLASEAPRVVPAQELMEAVQGSKSEVWEASDMARYHIYHIRRKITQATGCQDVIRTMRGVGYLLSD